MKDIIIIADFCSAFDGKDNNRFIYLSNLLVKKGNTVEIITSDFYHGTKRQFNPIVCEYGGAKVTMLHEPAYKKNVSLIRFLSHYIWGRRVFKYLKVRKKPDVIYCAIPTLTAAKLSGKYCHKNRVKFIVDIQDLWPEAYKMVFNVPIISPLVFMPFKLIVNSAYKYADEIVAVSQTYVDRALLVNKKIKQGYPVFLGTDLRTFDQSIKETNDVQKENNEIWLGYCGTLGASYDLKTVIDAIKIINNENLKLIVIGDGPERKKLEDYSAKLNVIFTGRLAYKDMCKILSKCDFVVNPIIHNAAQSIINKHADYAAAGKPVLNTQENNEYRLLIEKYQMGFNIANGDSSDLADKIVYLIEHPNEIIRMGKNSRKCAEELFDRKVTYGQILEVILNNGESDIK